MIDLVLKNCRIFGYDQGTDTIAIKDGRIVHVGSSDIRETKDTLDLEGRTVLPGFIDAHTHLQNLGLSLVRLDLSKTETRAEAIEMVQEYASKGGTKKIIGYGWDETRWGEKDYISKAELDGIAKPVVLYRRDMHMAVLNSKALTVLGMESPDGTVKEEKMRLLAGLTEPDNDEIGRAIHAAAEFAVSEGITTIRDIMGANVKQLLDSERTLLRVYQLMYDREYNDDQLNAPLSWGIKMFLDGSIGARSAAHNGWDAENLKFTSVELKSRLVDYWINGIPVAMHAIGEIAVEQAVDALRNQKGQQRNSIEHFELVQPEILDEIGKSTVVSSQPNFLQWSFKGGLYENTLGSEWFGKDNPFRTILDSGVNLAFGSDCMPMGPSYGIGLAINTPHSKQRISLDEAVRAYTEGSAYVLHEESISGRIATGYRADLTVFDEDYLQEPANIGTKKPAMTFVGGNMVYTRKIAGGE